MDGTAKIVFGVFPLICLLTVAVATRGRALFEIILDKMGLWLREHGLRFGF